MRNCMRNCQSIPKKNEKSGILRRWQNVTIVGPVQPRRKWGAAGVEAMTWKRSQIEWKVGIIINSWAIWNCGMKCVNWRKEHLNDQFGICEERLLSVEDLTQQFPKRQKNGCSEKKRPHALNIWGTWQSKAWRMATKSEMANGIWSQNWFSARYVAT